MLKTKISIPTPRNQWVMRERLLDKLNGITNSRLALISAPPGYGKTTLVASWVNVQAPKNHFSFAWLSLDNQDNDPVRFWMYVFTSLQDSLQRYNPKAILDDGLLQWIHSPQPVPIQNFQVELLNELTRIPEPIILILDDYQLIQNPVIHESIKYLLENLPDSLRLIICTRTTPVFIQAKYRARGWIMDVRLDDLKFTTDEVIDFFQRSIGINIQPDEVTALVIYTEGWITGLQMTALILNRFNPDQRVDLSGKMISKMIRSDRNILDYLAEEILSILPQDKKNFLFATSILDRFNSSLCQAVTGRQDCQQTIDQIEKENLFILTLDNQRNWYRYHPLFVELLQTYLKHDSVINIYALHQKAATWFLEHGLPEEAADHFIKMGDLDSAVRSMEQQMISWIQRGEYITLTSWLAQFPQYFIEKNALLCLGYGWAALYQVDFQDAEDWAKRAAAGMHQATSSFIQMQIDAIRATVAINMRDYEKAIRFSKQALPFIPEEMPVLKSLIYLNLGDAYSAQRYFSLAVDAYQVAYEAAHFCGNSMLEVVVIGSLGAMYLSQGKLRQAERILHQVNLVNYDSRFPHETELLAVGKPLIYLASVYLEWNQLDRARETAEKALQLCQRWGHISHIIDALCCQAHIDFASGNRIQADQRIQHAYQVIDDLDIAHQFSGEAYRFLKRSFRRKIRSEQAALAFYDQQADKLADWLDENGISPDKVTEKIDLLSGLYIGEMYYLTARYKDAQSLYERILTRPNIGEYPRYIIQVLSRLALVYQQIGENDCALSTLAKAISIAEPEGFIYSFIVLGEGVFNLINQLAGRSDTPNPEYVTKLLEEYKRTQNIRSLVIRDYLPGGKMEPLTDREYQLLRLLAAGFSYADMASSLYLSVNTIKTHLKKLYVKLGASNKMSAVDMARKRGLIP